MARGNFPSAKQDQFVLRFPNGLRDRIKTYAEAHGRSMNAEIVRILEREFPEPWSIEAKVSNLIEMVKAIAIGRESDASIEKISSLVEETVNGIISGRVRGVDEAARKKIETTWEAYLHEREKEDLLDHQYDLDPEEEEALRRTGETSKYAWDDGEIGPKEPKQTASVDRNDSNDPEFPG